MSPFAGHCSLRAQKAYQALHPVIRPSVRGFLVFEQQAANRD